MRKPMGQVAYEAFAGRMHELMPDGPSPELLREWHELPEPYRQAWGVAAGAVMDAVYAEMREGE